MCCRLGAGAAQAARQDRRGLDRSSELLRLSVIACTVLNALLYLAVTYSLRPLATITSALGALQAGNYRVRVPRIATLELAAIGQGCDTLAARRRSTIRASILPT